MNNLIFRRQFIMLSKEMQNPDYFSVTKLGRFNRDVFVTVDVVFHHGKNIRRILPSPQVKVRPVH